MEPFKESNRKPFRRYASSVANTDMLKEHACQLRSKRTWRGFVVNRQSRWLLLMKIDRMANLLFPKRLSTASLNKSLGKRSVGIYGNTNFKKGSMAILPNQITSNDGELNSEHAGASFNLFGDTSIQGRLGSKIQTNLNTDELEKIKAHYNPIFDESKGFIILISDNSLDPALKTEKEEEVKVFVKALSPYEEPQQENASSAVK
ncbi:hypothetical protein PVK06_023098 [Gossypium arboreum]|uniref:Uncharacterized protein n=1 Tax=Gossypium arboreum TaxID=29729 RepID=A0ABR0PAC9_GOSAR|nr:hypothetical protein PVK06_023098 [Gossypium arboreum]